MGKHGGRRAGAGAPKGNQHTATHGIYSQSIRDDETRKAFDQHYALLKTDPVSSLLASAALIKAHVDRVIRKAVDGFLMLEKIDTDGEKAHTTIKNLEITAPIADALARAGKIVAQANEIERVRRESGASNDGARIVIQLHPDVSEE